MKRSGRKQPCGQDGEHVIGIGAHRGNESPRPADAEAPQHILAARVCFDGKIAGVDRRLHAFGVALDDHERNRLPRELARHDLSDAAEAADDEMIREIVEHAFPAPSGPARLKVSLHEPRHEKRKRVKNRGDAEDDDAAVEHPPGARQRVNLAVPHRRHRRDRHVERVEHVPAFDYDVSRRADAQHRCQQHDRQPPSRPPG